MEKEYLSNSNLLKRIISVTLLILGFIIPAHAQEDDSDTKIMFRFRYDSDVFNLVYRHNGDSIDKLINMIDRSAVTPGSIRVEGYSSTKPLSKIRSNRVKSALISKAGLKESDFKTTNYAGRYHGMANVVVVTVPIFKATPAQPDTTEIPTAPVQTVDTVKETVCETPAVETVVEEEPRPQPKTPQHSLSLRANLLRWATLTPDLGIEWRIKEKWALLVNASYTSWRWNDKNRRYGLWEIAPEVRRYLGAKNRGYIGLMYKAGAFNYKFSELGRQGDIMGGGITGGYVVRLNNVLALDLNLGLGYIRAEYDRYSLIDGERVREGKEGKNWWGPVSAGVTLTWTLF